MTDNLKRTFYPWDDLHEVGDEFKIGLDNPRGQTHCRQLVFLRNKKMEKLGLDNRYSWRNIDDSIVIQRTK